MEELELLTIVYRRTPDNQRREVLIKGIDTDHTYVLSSGATSSAQSIGMFAIDAIANLSLALSRVDQEEYEVLDLPARMSLVDKYK